MKGVILISVKIKVHDYLICSIPIYDFKMNGYALLNIATDMHWIGLREIEVDFFFYICSEEI